MLGKIAIAMSVYKSDKIANIKESVDSILNQTYKNFDFYIAVDGVVNDDVRDYLISLNEVKNIMVVFFFYNKGLACRLNDIIDIVIKKNEYCFLARMDADDISYPERFSTQVRFLRENKDIAVVGSSAIEFYDNGGEKFKKMFTTHDELYFNIIKRCPFNHPTVMFNLSIFDKKDIIYDDSLQNTQDYYLWVELLKKGYRFSNIDKPLLRFRVDSDFFNRRGLKKAINDTKARYHAMKLLNLFTLSNVNHTVLLFILRISPSIIKKTAYQYLR